MRGFGLTFAGAKLVVLSLPTAVPRVPAGLSPAEAEIAKAVATGFTNSEIARRRGTSKRTVANQIAAIGRKTGASSRSEIAALLFTRPRAGSRSEK